MATDPVGLRPLAPPPGSRPPSTASKRTASAAAIAMALAGGYEGVQYVAYLDPVGVPTICFGSTRGVKIGDTATVAECKAKFTVEMQAAVDAVERCVPGLPVNVLAAFGSAVYNLGPRIACETKSSTAARMLKAGKFMEACAQLPRWNKATLFGVGLIELPGLTLRRAAERELCETPEVQPEKVSYHANVITSPAALGPGYRYARPSQQGWSRGRATVLFACGRNRQGGQRDAGRPGLWRAGSVSIAYALPGPNARTRAHAFAGSHASASADARAFS